VKVGIYEEILLTKIPLIINSNIENVNLFNNKNKTPPFTLVLQTTFTKELLEKLKDIKEDKYK
jgi:hypothetical protein